MKIKRLNDAAKVAHKDAKDKGFYDKPIELGTRLMLVNSELVEALEADRKCNHANVANFKNTIKSASKYMLSDKNKHMFKESEPFKQSFEEHIKDTFEDEIADTFIRLLDLVGYMDIDIEWHIEQKMKYNKLREKLNGKKY